MIIKVFECAEHEEYGEIGWREKGKSHFQPLQGMAVAHDCLEHFPDDHAAIECELEALGAMLYIRGENPDRMHHEAWEDMESDMTDLYRLFRYEDTRFSDAPPKIQHHLRGFAEDQITKLEKHLSEFLMKNEHNGDEEEREADNRSSVDEFVGRIGWWIRNGYRRARKRYGPNRYGELYYFFKGIREEADRHLKFAEDRCHELTVKFCIKERWAEVTVHDLREDDYPDEEDEEDAEEQLDEQQPAVHAGGG